MLISFI